MVPPDPAEGVTVKVFFVNVAVTEVSAVSAMVQESVPLQPPPDQPVNVELA